VGQQLAEGYRIELVGIEAVMGHTEGIKKGSVNISGA